MQNISLKECLSEIEKITNQEWLNSLDDRKIKELHFHDQRRNHQKLAEMDKDTYDKLYANKKYYTTTSLSRDYMESWISTNVKDKIFLDFACGNGEIAIKAAKYGAKLAIGIDISSTSIENAKKEAAIHGVSDNTYFLQGDAENTKLPSNSIEVVVCAGVLHHLDLSYALYELRRILVPGGKALAIEALDYNPFIKLYRKLTPNMRTEWEKAHILSLKDTKFASRFFHIKNVKFWHITSYLAVYAKVMLPIFNFFDSIATKIPFFRLMAWTFTFEMEKKET